VLNLQNDHNFTVTVVEIKTRVSHQRIAAAESIYDRFQSMWIEANVGDKIWQSCIEPDHQIQLMTQMAVTRASYCCYVVGKAGFEGSHGQMLYIVRASVTSEVLDAFVALLRHRCHLLLSPFFTAGSVGTIVASLPHGLPYESEEIVRKHWPFFYLLRGFVRTRYDPPMGFPATSLFKTPFQSTYNALKGWARQQYTTILHNKAHDEDEI
jgi:hypothetical protein